MSTRGAYGFKINGVNKIAFNPCDSYMEGLGADILNFIAKTPLAEIRRIAESIVMLKGNEKPTRKQFENHAQQLGLDVSATPVSWEPIIEKMDPLFGLKDIPYMYNGEDFLEDGLFCEWAYIIDLDAGVLKIYNNGNSNLLKTIALKGLYRAGKAKIVRICQQVKTVMC